MSDRTVRIVAIDRVEPHPDADRLDVAHVGGYPCVVKRGEFSAGDKATYIPVDMTVPVARPEFAFLEPRAGKDGRCRIKAMRLRGIFSMGLLLPVADDVEALGVLPYVAPWDVDNDWQDVPPPSHEPPRYDLESLRRHPDVLQPGEQIVVTEKLHGSNGRAYRDADGVLHVGSHGRWKRVDGTSEWALAARGRFDALPKGQCLYWECIGKVGGFAYGVPRGTVSLRVFDSFSMKWQWLDWANTSAMAKLLGVQTVPVLYVGGYDAAAVAALAEGPSMLGDHVREGIVVRPARERYDARCGRVVLKMHGEGFLTRGGKR